MPKFGTYAQNSLGWPRVDVKDSYDNACSLQLSSVIYDYPDAFEKPGTSALWLGLSDVKAQVMARDAASLGIHADTDVGWVDYPIPKEVLVWTRMHLNREQVSGLISRLTEWLETGRLSPSQDSVQ
jgi:hypothetical protein